MAKKKKELTLADQFKANNKIANSKWSAKNMITPHPESKGGNGIPTLIDSNGLLKSSIDPQVLTSSSTPDIVSAAQASASTGPITLSSGGMGEAVTTSSDDKVKMNFYRRFREDNESEDTVSEDELETAMKINYDNLRSRANSIFENLNINVEWDSFSRLIHILIKINDAVTDDLPKDDTSLYPYPLDIIIPIDSDAVLTYNSKKSIYNPDMSTEISDSESDFNILKWYGRSNGLQATLFDNLIGLDEALSEYVINPDLDEAFMEADDGSEIDYADYYNDDYPGYKGYTLVDTKEVPSKSGSKIKYDWIMNSNQTSLFIIDEDKTDKSIDDVSEAQEWWDSYIEFDDSTEVSESAGRILSQGELSDYRITEEELQSHLIESLGKMSINEDIDDTNIYPYRIYRYSNKYIVKPNTRGDSFSKANNYPMTQAQYDEWRVLTNDRDTIIRLAEPSLDKKLTPFFRRIDQSLEYDQYHPKNEDYAVIKTTAPFGADAYMAVDNRDEATKIAKSLNSKTDSSEVKFIARSLTDDNIDKYDLKTEEVLLSLSKIITKEDL